jgi:tetratricopeptide (TPR) repeat protein
VARDRGLPTDCRFLNLLQDHLDGRLAPPLAEELRRHLDAPAACPACLAELAQLRRVRQVLRAAAALPPPPFEPDANFSRLAPSLGFRLPRWVPALAAGAAAAALLLALVLVPQRGDPVPRPAGPAAEGECFPLLALRGSAAGLLPGPCVPADGVVRLAPDARLVVVPERSLVLAADEGSVFHLQREDAGGLEATLERGRLAVHLAPGSSRPGVTVRVPFGALEALGTAFVVRLAPDGEAAVMLIEGVLRVVPAHGAAFEVQGPCRLTLGSADPEPLAPLGVEEAALLLDAFPEEGLRDPRLAWLTYHASPRPRASVELPASPRVSSPGEGSGEELLARARRLLAARQVGEARGLLDAHLAQNPADQRARMLRADALRLGGEPAAARDAYLALAQDGGADTQREAALFEAGLLELRALGAPAQALTRFDELRRRFPRGLLRQEVAFHLAECYLGLGDFRRARRALEDYLRLYPAGTQAQAARGWLQELEAKGWR